ncbi:TPA: DUF58 domain-containing protein [Candidatus Woesearchaeota archaeon]|nr:DUF58 domain-containing protein [Candidatus Woesearchaeota archaeon]
MAIDITFLRELDRFDVILKKRVHSSYSGLHQSKNYGTGLVFYDYRSYTPGDDFRTIDWRAYARTETFFVKRFEEEKNARIHVVIDASASMNYGDKVKKFEYAAQIGIGFCYMALRNNERFEISTFADQLQIFRAKKGMSTLMSTIDILNKVTPKGHSNFQVSLEQYKAAIKHKSMVIIISDFLFDPEELKETLFRYKKSEVVVIQVLDVTERELALQGDVILTDSETADRMRTFISNRLIENYSNELLEHIYKIKNVCEAFNVKFISVSTETPVFDCFYNVLGRAERTII